MTQFIVHVGPHKTGSTYLQECFAQLRPQLAERGIHFPTTWGPVAHHALSDALSTVPNPKLEAQFAALHAARHATVLISAEGLTGLPDASIAYFRSLIGAEHKLRCIFYARAWGDILPSHWKESVKGGDSMTLPEYLFRRLHNPVVSFFVNFGVGLRIWARYFGPGAISIVAYNQLVALRLDLFRHFADRFLGWPDPPALDVAATNVSPGTTDIEAIRAVAALERLRAGRVLPHRYAGALATQYMKRRAELVTPTVAAALEGHTGRLFVNEGMPALAALHKELMAEFGAALVPPRLPNFFFRPRRAEILYVTPDWLLEAGVLDELRAIQRTLRAEVEAAGRRADGP
jgi:hypothetical protein